jgi:hypothetical protein
LKEIVYTTLPHDKLKTGLKETIHKAFSHRNDGSKYVVLGRSSDPLPEGMLKEVMNDLWLARISSLSNEVGLYIPGRIFVRGT